VNGIDIDIDIDIGIGIGIGNDIGIGFDGWDPSIHPHNHQSMHGASEWCKWTVQVHGASEWCKSMGASEWHWH